MNPIAAVAFAVIAASPCDPGEWAWASYYREQSQVFCITETQALGSPKWTDTSSIPPLSLARAAEIAMRQLGIIAGDPTGWTITGAELNPFWIIEDRWIWIIQLAPPEHLRSPNGSYHPVAIPVLMNGESVPPRIVPWEKIAKTEGF